MGVSFTSTSRETPLERLARGLRGLASTALKAYAAALMLTGLLVEAQLGLIEGLSSRGEVGKVRREKVRVE